MNKRTSLFTIALIMGSMLSAVAQQVTTLHMKDGSKLVYRNGVKNATEINFWGFQPDTTTYNHYMQAGTSFGNGWNVNGVAHVDKQYAACIFWTDDVPYNFQAEHGVCFGSKPGLTLEECDTVALYDSNNRVVKGFGYDYLSTQEHYMLIAPRFLTDRYTVRTADGWVQLQVSRADSVRNIVRCQMAYGQTYYYRTFARGWASEGGQRKPVVFYGQERSIRVPIVMADHDYYLRPYPSQEAIAAFQQNFQGVTPPEWEQLNNLWELWRASADGKDFDLSPYITTREFEDGTGYRLNQVPTEFYKWLTRRTIVLSPFDTIIKKAASANGDSIELAAMEQVTNVAERWGVPNGCYARFTPTNTSQNYGVTYCASEVIPGVNYKVYLKFAPETLFENNEETASNFVPTLVRINVTDGSKNVRLFAQEEIPATELTTLQQDYLFQKMGTDISVETRVSNVQIRNGTYNRILRVAAVYLVPEMEMDFDEIAGNLELGADTTYYSLNTAVDPQSLNVSSSASWLSGKLVNQAGKWQLMLVSKTNADVFGRTATIRLSGSGYDKTVEVQQPGTASFSKASVKFSFAARGAFYDSTENPSSWTDDTDFTSFGYGGLVPVGCVRNGNTLTLTGNYSHRDSSADDDESATYPGKDAAECIYDDNNIMLNIVMDVTENPGKVISASMSHVYTDYNHKWGYVDGALYYNYKTVNTYNAEVSFVQSTENSYDGNSSGSYSVSDPLRIGRFVYQNTYDRITRHNPDPETWSEVVTRKTFGGLPADSQNHTVTVYVGK